MDIMKEIYDFSIKWKSRYIDLQTSPQQLLNKEFNDECRRLGFVMDCLKSFNRKYGKAGFDVEELAKIINEIDDIAILGSAIYSNWYYYQHFSLNGIENINKNETRKWFNIALQQLEKLTTINKKVYEGEIIKIRIISYKKVDETINKGVNLIKQELIIDNLSNIVFKQYDYYYRDHYYSETRAEENTINIKVCNKLIEVMGNYFIDDYNEFYNTNEVDWIIELENNQEVKYCYRGLFTYLNVFGFNLSDIIRGSLNIDNLIVFDGKFENNRR